MMKMGICMSNLTNLWDYRDRGMEVFPVNFPSLDGRGYVVATTNGFCVFDNGDTKKFRRQRILSAISIQMRN